MPWFKVLRTSDLFTWLWFTFMPKWVALRKDVFSFGENRDSNVKSTSFVNLCKLKSYFSLPPRVFKFFFFFWVDCFLFWYLGYWFWLRLNDEDGTIVGWSIWRAMLFKIQFCLTNSLDFVLCLFVIFSLSLSLSLMFLLV